jgi:uncharacterized membrane protein YbhN (UPF0104 family)
MKKWILGFSISAIAIYFLLQNFDLKEFERLKGKMEWKFLFFLILSNLWAFVPFALRWYYLLDKKVSFPSAYASSVIGVGLNMVLPARGGELVRLLINKKDSGLTLPNLVSKLFLEKIMDLSTVVLVGASALFYLGLGDNKNLGLIYISGFVLISMFGGLIALRIFLGPMRNLFRKLFSLVKKEALYDQKIDHHLIEFSEFLKGRKLIRPVIFSIPTWILGYALSYWLAGQLIGISLGYPEVLLLIFVGAMGVAIPSAPSGIGVFHASVISGFLLLGRDSGEGFVFATVIHLAQFVIITSLAIIFYLGWTFLSKEKTMH